jgi:hypothetical protein
MARRTYRPSPSGLHAKAAWIETAESDLRNLSTKGPLKSRAGEGR